jgi:hypothetical protein
VVGGPSLGETEIAAEVVAMEVRSTAPLALAVIADAEAHTTTAPAAATPIDTRLTRPLLPPQTSPHAPLKYTTTPPI